MCGYLMVKIVIENLGKKELLVNISGKTVLSHFQDHFVDWMHACGGKGRCTTCKMNITLGWDNLSPLTAAELKYRGEGMLLATERLACQAKLQGDLCLRVPEEGKLPHLIYTKA